MMKNVGDTVKRYGCNQQSFFKRCTPLDDETDKYSELYRHRDATFSSVYKHADAPCIDNRAITQHYHNIII